MQRVATTLETNRWLQVLLTPFEITLEKMGCKSCRTMFASKNTKQESEKQTARSACFSNHHLCRLTGRCCSAGSVAGSCCAPQLQRGENNEVYFAGVKFGKCLVNVITAVH